MTGAAAALPTDAAIKDNLALRIDRQRPQRYCSSCFKREHAQMAKPVA